MLALIIFITLCFGSAAIGSYFTNLTVKTWYTTIRKPSWNPPNKVFAPVWSLLYLMMAVSGWLIWERMPTKGLDQSMMLFGIQLILNTAWSALFFGLRNPKLAFFEIIPLWVFILLTMLNFWSIYWLAGALFVPYLLWVSFAAFLNYTVWRMNIKTS